MMLKPCGLDPCSLVLVYTYNKDSEHSQRSLRVKINQYDATNRGNMSKMMLLGGWSMVVLINVNNVLFNKRCVSDPCSLLVYTQQLRFGTQNQNTYYEVKQNNDSLVVDSEYGSKTTPFWFMVVMLIVKTLWFGSMFSMSILYKTIEIARSRLRLV